jgi:hypothetical protein
VKRAALLSAELEGARLGAAKTLTLARGTKQVVFGEFGTAEEHEAKTAVSKMRALPRAPSETPRTRAITEKHHGGATIVRAKRAGSEAQ